VVTLELNSAFADVARSLLIAELQTAVSGHVLEPWTSPSRTKQSDEPQFLIEDQKKFVL